MNAATKDALELLGQTRKNVLGICQAHSLEELNHVPESFNNNLIWNAGHLVATMELLTYALAGLPTPSGRTFIDQYRRGTRPTGDVTQREVDFILNELAVGPGRFAADLKQLDFSNYKEYPTSYGVTLHDISEAVIFNNMHEAMHLGTMLALKKLV